MKKKKLLLALLAFFFIIITACFAFGFFVVQQSKKNSQKLFFAILNNKEQSFAANFATWQKNLRQLKTITSLIKPLVKFFPKNYFTLINQTNELLTLTIKFSPYLPEILGQNKSKTYFALLQNNLELRPTGGFMGSYAKLKFKQGGLTNFIVQDIYVPDGQILGHVDPPWPIQQAFGQGWWRLRDSNWSLDFPTAAKQINWFFQKGKEEKANGIIALNLIFVKDLIKIVEPLYLPDYDYFLTAENFYQHAQNEAEKNFFPGSTQKKDFLSAVSKVLFLKLKNANNKQLVQLIKVIKNALDEKQILLSIDNKHLNSFFTKQNWNGTVKRKNFNSGNQIIDYIYIADTNLGANKANCCVTRKVSQKINFNNNLIKEKLKIIYFNNSQKKRPKPPLFWGGVYKNFLRIVLPLEANNIKISVNNKPYKEKIDEQKNIKKRLKTIGFFIIVEPQTEKKISLEYEIKAANLKKYALQIQKQPGISNYPHYINFISPQKKFSREFKIKTDTIIKLLP